MDFHLPLEIWLLPFFILPCLAIYFHIDYDNFRKNILLRNEEI